MLYKNKYIGYKYTIYDEGADVDDDDDNSDDDKYGHLSIYS